jgi:Fe-S-cluster-containing hydrogenase component 2/CRP-like cAMP-binding protein
MAESFDTLDFVAGARDDEEGLFSRDINGELVRLDAPTEGDYRKNINLEIDGVKVTVPMAEPLKDAQGNVVRDIGGRTTPKYTTIYDAAVQLYVKNPGDEAKIPIPTLCHQQHMTPVGVCRMCVVQVYGQKRGARAAERKLLPACMHPVKEKMEVFTMNAEGADGERVRGAVKVLSELLAANHLKPAPAPAPAAELARFNELQLIATRCGASISRFTTSVLKEAPATSPQSSTGAANSAGGSSALQRRIDATSPVFLIDQSACILCERCMRACDEVKKNNIIGRSGKGPTAKIAFDLDDPMGKSGCVQCGECMVSCPTTAITFKPVAQVKVESGADGREQVLQAEDLIADPLFAGVPAKFLLWQQGLAIRRFVKTGDVLYHQGEPGNTAFIIKRGTFEVKAWPPGEAPGRGGKGGLLGLFKGAKKPSQPLWTNELTPEDVIMGEMACLSGTPRTADVTAMSDGEVWEVRRNVLDRLMRTPSQRGRFEGIYRSRSLNSVLLLDVFQGLWKEEYSALTEFLRPKLAFVRAEPGQNIFRQGDPADNLYMIRLGHVRIDIERPGLEPAVLYQGPGSVIGETDLLALSQSDRTRTTDEVDEALDGKLNGAKGALASVVAAGSRSATATALDRLELVRLGREDFLKMVRDFPTVRRRLVDQSLNRLRIASGDTEQGGLPAVREYVTQGLYQGQSLLVLDLNKCTRCDECTRACIDQHGTQTHGTPFTRLRRDGMQFKNFLIATACRSCKDAYCMVGCPVDAIHRGKHQQIVIEDHCIGCGLCATNCPYGNIWLVPDQNRIIETADPDNPGETRKLAQLKAATCDLCDADGKMDEPVPRCVYACPHDAAHRMTGEELLSLVTSTNAATPATSAIDAAPNLAAR